MKFHLIKVVVYTRPEGLGKLQKVTAGPSYGLPSALCSNLIPQELASAALLRLNELKLCEMYNDGCVGVVLGSSICSMSL